MNGDFWEEDEPMFLDQAPPAEDMGPVDEKAAGGKKPPRKLNTPAKRAQAIAANVVFANPIAQAQAMHAASVQHQGAVMQDSLDRTMAAIDKENYSRVDQVREERQRQHELQLESMRQQGALDRLNAMHQARSGSAGGPEGPGGGLRWWNPKTRQWEYGTRFRIDGNGPSMT